MFVDRGSDCFFFFQAEDGIRRVRSSAASDVYKRQVLTQPFTFYGFLPRKKKEQKDVLSALKEERPTQIFYESPYRIAKTVATFAEVYGQELSLIHIEPTRRTPISYAVFCLKKKKTITTPINEHH